MTIYFHYIVIAYESPRRTSLKFKVLHFLLNSLRNGGVGEKNWIIVMNCDVRGCGLKKVFLNGP